MYFRARKKCANSEYLQNRRQQIMQFAFKEENIVSAYTRTGEEIRTSLRLQQAHTGRIVSRLLLRYEN